MDEIEYLDIVKKQKFDLSIHSLEGKQFGLTSSEVFRFTDFDISKVGVFKVTIPKKILEKFHYSNTIDTAIFKSGVITVPKTEMETLNKNILLLLEEK